MTAKSSVSRDKQYELYSQAPLEFFQSELKIITKAGKGLAPLKINNSQFLVHRKLEAQKKKTGLVRALLLKGRQQGMSTYVEARYFHKNLFLAGINTLIMAHLSSSSSAIFRMVKRFYDELSPGMKPSLGTSNWQTLEFIRHKNIYQVLTAGSEDAGRGLTIHNFHGSEVAFWDKAEDIVAGAMQALSDAPGTESLLESTGRAGTWFHRFWDKSVEGETGYLPIFIPWTMQEEYAVADSDIPKDYYLSDEEEELQLLYKPTPNQIIWRRRQVAKLGLALFKQEYPFTPEEAFSAVDGDPYIPTEFVLRAVKAQEVEGKGAVILGLDPARFGDDVTAFAWRQGRRVRALYAMHKSSGPDIAFFVKQIFEGKTRFPVPDRMYMDITGMGGPIYDTITELTLSESDADKVWGVNYSNAAMNKEKYDIRRNEIWGNMRDWLMQEDVAVSIPDHKLLIGDLVAPKKVYNKKGQLCVESKEDMKKRGIKSPNFGDALALTLSHPVSKHEVEAYARLSSGPLFAPERSKAFLV